MLANGERHAGLLKLANLADRKPATKRLVNEILKAGSTLGAVVNEIGHHHKSYQATFIDAFSKFIKRFETLARQQRVFEILDVASRPPGTRI